MSIDLGEREAAQEIEDESGGERVAGTDGVNDGRGDGRASRFLAARKQKRAESLSQIHIEDPKRWASADVIAHTSNRPFIRGGVPRSVVIGLLFASAREAFIVVCRDLHSGPR